MLRDYQIKVLNRIKDFIKEPSNELIIKLYTGLGKTFLMPHIAKELNELGYKVLITSDIMQLINQLKEHFENINLELTIIEANNKETELKDIVLASEQTLYNRLNDISKVNNLIILYDEAHKRRKGKRFVEIVNKLQPIKLIGFSATPFDEKNNSISENIYEPISYLEAEKKGYLAKCIYKIPKFIEQLDFSEPTGIDYTKDEIRKIYKTKEFGEWFKDWFKNLDEKQTIIFTSSIEMAEWVGSLIGSHTYHSKNQNDELIDKFKKGEIKTLIGVSSLTIGFDAPNIERIIELRPTKIKSLFYQMIGRGSRVTENKKEFEYICLSNNLFTHSIPELDDYRISNAIEALFKNSENECFEFDYKDVETFVKWFKNHFYITSASIKELKLAFDYTDDIRMIVNIANEVHRRKRGWLLRTNQVEEIIKQMVFYLEKLSEYNKAKSTIKAYKTRIRNILNSDKKLISMKYFPKWFYENTIKKYNF